MGSNFWRAVLEKLEEDEMVPDREEDIRPRFHRSRSHHVDGGGGVIMAASPDGIDTVNYYVKFSK